MQNIIRWITLLLLVHSGFSQAGVTRSCESSNHHIVGTMRLADGSIRDNVVVPFHGVDPIMADGYHWLRPPMARRAACENASREAVEKMQLRRNHELVITMCDVRITGMSGVVSVLPQAVGAEAWHGSENNWNRGNVASTWQNCDEREDQVINKRYQYPIQYGSYNTLLDWCYSWGNGCGAQAAQAFCIKEGYARQISFSGPMNITAGQKTRIISSKEVCDQLSCGTFTQITCRNW